MTGTWLHDDEHDDDADETTGFTTVAVDTGKALDLYVENPNGDTIVFAGERSDVLVRWEKEGRSRTPLLDDATVQVLHEDDNRITVKIALPSLWSGGDFGRSVLKFLEGGLKGGNPFGMLSNSRFSFDLQIELPRQLLEAGSSRVRVRTANGDVRLAEIIGGIDVATANGDITVVEPRGETSLHVANGDLTIDRPVGTVTARSVSGDLTLAGGNLRRFTVTTVSGDAKVETILTGDASRLESVSGDMTLNLTFPAATGGTISARSVSGDAKVEPPFRAVAKRTWRIGPGSDDGPSVAVKSVSGDLRVPGVLSTEVTKSTETGMLNVPVAPQAPHAPQPPDLPFPPSPPAPPVPPTRFGVSAPSDPTEPITPVTPVTSSHSDAPSPPEEPAQDPRLAILQAVERGEIDIEEAMRRLDARR